jgi:phenylacetate-coenzyme A ligase PaaK-like adenylate-forming protein
LCCKEIRSNILFCLVKRYPFNCFFYEHKKYLYETAKCALRSYPIIHPYIREVERLYAMTPEQLRMRNERRFLEIFRRAYGKSPFYHKFYTEAGIKKEDITCLAGISSSLYSLALFLKEAGLRVKIPVAFTSSETLLDYQRNLIQDRLGTELYDNYGIDHLQCCCGGMRRKLNVYPSKKN